MDILKAGVGCPDIRRWPVQRDGFLCAFLGAWPLVSDACPDFTQAAVQSYSATATQLLDPVTFDVAAGGPYWLENCGGVRSGPTPGFFAEAPDFSFVLEGLARYRLEISARADCDTVLLLSSAHANWYYDDDDNGGLDPKIMLTRPVDGKIDIWVGTHEASNCRAAMTLQTFER